MNPSLQVPFESVPGLCRDELLHELFEHQAHARPGQIALACADERMTYGELDDKSTQLARLLRARGLGCGAKAGLFLPRSLDVYAGLLAILKSGADVPLDPDYPADRVHYILSDCQAEAEINADATLQTHLFEDRVMKMSRVDIGARANVGSVSLVLYDTRMEDGSKLNDLSLLMKGESLPAGTSWEGVPARPAAVK